MSENRLLRRISPHSLQTFKPIDARRPMPDARAPRTLYLNMHTIWAPVRGQGKIIIMIIRFEMDVKRACILAPDRQKFELVSPSHA